MNSSTVTPYIYIDGCNDNTDKDIPGGGGETSLTLSDALYGQEYTFILWAYVINTGGSGVLDSEPTGQSTKIGESIIFNLSLQMFIF